MLGEVVALIYTSATSFCGQLHASRMRARNSQDLHGTMSHGIEVDLQSRTESPVHPPITSLQLFISGLPRYSAITWQTYSTRHPMTFYQEYLGRLVTILLSLYDSNSGSCISLVSTSFERLGDTIATRLPPRRFISLQVRITGQNNRGYVLAFSLRITL